MNKQELVELLQKLIYQKSEYIIDTDEEYIGFIVNILEAKGVLNLEYDSEKTKLYNIN